MLKNFELWRLRRKQRKSNEEYSRLVDEAKDPEEQQFRMSEAVDADEQYRDKIMGLQSRLLRNQAERLGIPVPSFSDKNSWDAGYVPGTWHLSLTAQLQLRQAIRTERRDKWGFAAFLLKDVATPIIGGIGAIMGLISLIHALRSK